jgi:hypothetical protein
MAPATALKNCCSIDGLLLISLCLTFGGSPCPNIWESIGQPICNLANELIQNSSWSHSALFDPLSNQLLVPHRLPPDTPFGQALPLAVDTPVNDKGKGDIYIDDSIFICCDLHNNTERIAKAVPLAINTITRPVAVSEPLPRKHFISMKKFIAEASFNECKTVLGWILSTRIFTIHLPENKFISWCSSIDSIISNKKASLKLLHSTEGWLNHADYVIPTMRHFLSRICALQMVAEKTKKQKVYILTPILHVLSLCKKFLSWVKDRISLNLVTFCTPTIYYRSDACEYGLGGYNTYAGRACRFQIPPDCVWQAHINTLEFLASTISIWVDILNNNVSANDCFLSQTDSTTAAGWLKKVRLQ